MGELHERHSWRKERSKESLFHKINKEKSFDYRFTTKTFKLLVISLIILAFSTIAFGAIGKNNTIPYTVSGTKDPIVPIYYFCDSSADLGRFKYTNSTGSVINSYRFATEQTARSCDPNLPSHAIQLQSNTTASAFAIDQQPINLDTVGGRHMQMNFAFAYQNTPNNAPIFHVFLTTNKTAPLEVKNYAPQNDPNVYLDTIVFPSTNSFSVISYVKSDQSRSISSLDNGCNNGGSPLICGSQTGTNTPQGSIFSVSLTLNYTGITSQATQNVLLVASGSTILTTDRQYKQPPTFFQSRTFYWGIAEQPNPTPFLIQFWDNAYPVIQDPQSFLNGWIIGVWSPPVAVVTIPANTPDTSFFGAVGRGLTSVYNGVTGALSTAYNAVAGPIANIGGSFVSTIISGFTNLIALFAQGLRIFLNTVGGWFGIGNVGDRIIDFFTGIANFFVSVIGGGFSILDELASEGNKIITAIINFFTNGLTIFNFVNDFLNSMSGLWNIIVGGWNEFLHWYNIGSMSISYFLVLWYFFGIYQVYLDGIHGLKSWLDMSEMFLLSIFRAGYWFSKESFMIVLTIKQLVAGWV